MTVPATLLIQFIDHYANASDAGSISVDTPGGESERCARALFKTPSGAITVLAVVAVEGDEGPELEAELWRDDEAALALSTLWLRQRGVPC
jgi:hypothetical protein